MTSHAHPQFNTIHNPQPAYIFNTTHPVILFPKHDSNCMCMYASLCMFLLNYASLIYCIIQNKKYT